MQMLQGYIRTVEQEQDGFTHLGDLEEEEEEEEDVASQEEDGSRIGETRRIQAVCNDIRQTM